MEDSKTVMARKLKVYRTPIGFHDAYVAAPSQKEALKAWGSEVDLFARGVAEQVRDEALMRAPLATPGAVIKRPRGIDDAFMASLPEEPRPRRRHVPPETEDGPPPRRRRETARSRRPPASPSASAQPQAKAKPPPKSKPKRTRPRPSRAKLEAAEAALERAQSEHGTAITKLRERERALQQERRALERDHDARVAKLEEAISRERDRYSDALRTWRG